MVFYPPMGENPVSGYSYLRSLRDLCVIFEK